jgi:hypothetical protein
LGYPLAPGYEHFAMTRVEAEMLFAIWVPETNMRKQGVTAIGLEQVNGRQASTCQPVL